MSIISEIKQIKTDKKSLFKFAMTMGVFFALIAGWSIYKHKPFGLYLALTSGVFFIAGFTSANILKPLYIVWMSFATIMNFFMSKLLLALLFFLVLTPIGIIRRLLGNNKLGTSFQDKKDSYWVPCQNKENNYEKQF